LSAEVLDNICFKKPLLNISRGRERGKCLHPVAPAGTHACIHNAVVTVISMQLSASRKTLWTDCNMPSNFVNEHTSTMCCCRHSWRTDLVKTQPA